MIVNFRVGNFLSFRDEVEFTALATLERQHRDRVAHSEQPFPVRVLPAAAFYGGNGSGKSNLFKALGYARHLILQAGTKPEDGTGRDPFRLDPLCVPTPSTFGFDLFIDDKVLRYQFAVSNDFVEAESLEIVHTSSSLMVFKRHREGGNDVWDTTSFKRLNLPKEDHDFLRFKIRDTLPNQLFMAVIRGRNIPLLEDVGHWFRHRLVLLDPHTDYRPVEIGLLHVDAFKNYCIESLLKAGTGIDKIQTTPVSWDEISMPEKVRDKMIKSLQAGKPGVMQMIRGPNRARFLLSNVDGKIEALRITTSHNTTDGEQASFELYDESEGTERLIDLLPAFFDMTNADSQRIFFVDEIDRSLHTHLTRGLIESFLGARTQASRTQLLFTTHDPLLLDQDLFRRDEIWFLDKMDNGHSKLTALSDFKGVRFDKDIRKNYLLGRFAGVPPMGRFPKAGAKQVNPE